MPTFVCCPLSLCVLKNSHSHAAASQNLWIVRAVMDSRLSLQGGHNPRHTQLWWAGHALETSANMGANVCRIPFTLGPIQPSHGINVVRSLCQGANSEQCSRYRGSLGYFHGDVSGVDMETHIWPFSINSHSSVSWLEVGVRLQSPKLFLQWGICAESSKKNLRRNELPAKYKLFHFKGHHPIYLTSQSFSNF